ncbi:MAG: hypothetical protein ACJAVK_001194 [Akkermansiaceae bacterium]
MPPDLRDWINKDHLVHFIMDAASCFHQILELATLANILKVGDVTVSGDGTKLFANASKHSAMGHDRIATLKEAKAVLEERAKIRFEKEQTEHEQKLAQRQAKEDKTGRKPRGKTPKLPEPEPGPRPKDQYNFTDPESRILKSGGGFEQCDNFQAAFEVATMLIIGGLVTDAANHKEQLIPLIQAISPTVGTIENILVDSGYLSEKAVTIAETRAHRLSTKVGRALYKLRKETVEPVCGIIKEVLGFRRFMLRGMEKVELESTLVKSSDNLKRLHKLGMTFKTS